MASGKKQKEHEIILFSIEPFQFVAKFLVRDEHFGAMLKIQEISMHDGLFQSRIYQSNRFVSSRIYQSNISLVQCEQVFATCLYAICANI